MTAHARTIGAALFSTIAATATAAHLAAHAGAASATAAVHGCTVAMAWGMAILPAAAIPVAALINAPVPRSR